MGNELAKVFREVVPDLSPPDLAGWASGTCPYCKVTGAFRANLKSGRWLCLPPGDDPSPNAAPGPKDDAGCDQQHVQAAKADLRRWADRWGIPWPEAAK